MSERPESLRGRLGHPHLSLAEKLVTLGGALAAIALLIVRLVTGA